MRLHKASSENMHRILEIGRKVDCPTNPSVTTKEELAHMMNTLGWTVEVAVFQKTVVGILIWEQRSPTHVHLSDLAIDPAFQGHGLGRKILSSFLSRKGMSSVDLLTHEKNVCARALYCELGFKRVATIANAYKNGLSFLRLKWTSR